MSGCCTTNYYNGCCCDICNYDRVKLNQLPVEPRVAANTAFIGNDGRAYTVQAIKNYLLLASTGITTTQVTGDTSTAAAGRFNRYEYTDTSSPYTFTLSTADMQSGNPINNYQVDIKDKTGAASANNITIVREDAGLIEGAASIVITADYGIARLYSDGSNWYTR